MWLYYNKMKIFFKIDIFAKAGIGIDLGFIVLDQNND